MCKQNVKTNTISISTFEQNRYTFLLDFQLSQILKGAKRGEIIILQIVFFLVKQIRLDYFHEKKEKCFR